MNKEIEALSIIKKYSENFRKRVVLFSGGKDSLVVLHLTLRALGEDAFSVLYTEITGNTAPECTKYAISICKQFGVKCVLAYRKLNFWNMFRKAGFPYKKGFRWCAEHFKYKIWKEYGGKDTLYITGVKGGDRVLRAKKVKPFQFVKLWNSYALAPLYNWDTKDVLNYIKKYDLKINPLYREIGHSGNCLYCPFLNKRAFIRTITKYWNISTVLYEILLDPPVSDMKHKKGMVKGSQEVHDQLVRWIEELDNENLAFFFDDFDKLDCLDCEDLINFLKCEKGDGSIVFKKIEK